MNCLALQDVLQQQGVEAKVLTAMEIQHIDVYKRQVIHSALKYAVKTDMLIQNVADKVDRPRKNSLQPVFLSADEMQNMFEALRGTKLELPVLVAAFYGLRRGEVEDMYRRTSGTPEKLSGSSVPVSGKR